MRIKISGLIFIVFIVSSLLAACASPKVATEVVKPTEPPYPSLTDTPPRATNTPEPTPTDTPMPLVEPVLPPQALTGILPTNPPNFETAEVLKAHSFDLSAAHAVYAWYRQQEGPAMWTDDVAFISDMAEYTEIFEAQGIKLKQATVEGMSYTLLTHGNEILLNFDTDGALTNSDPSRWSKDSTPEWIDAGGEVELFIGEDGHAYITKVNDDGNVTAFLNTIGATRDNLDDHWIEVRDGQSVMVWDDQKGWVENPLANISSEWQGKIDRIETLPDGRTVAIAAAENPDEESLLRLLQLDPATNEWVQYVPLILDRIITDGAVNYLFPQGAPELINLSEVKLSTFNNLTENTEIPLGYIKRTYLDDEKEIWLDWVSGAVIGYSAPSEGMIFNIRIQVPTRSGDLAIIDIDIVNEFQSGSRVYTLESFSPSMEIETFEEAGLNTGVNNNWEIRGSQLYEYFLSHQNDWLGQQIIFGIIGGKADRLEYNPLIDTSEANTTELRQELIDYLLGGELPNLGRIDDLSIMITPSEGLIFPQEVIEDINNY